MKNYKKLAQIKTIGLWPLILFILFFLDEPLHAKHRVSFEPLYAGTLLAIYPMNTPPGDVSLQPYLFAIRQNGFYSDHWSFQKQKNIDKLSVLFSVETGITSFLDVDLFLTGNYNRFGNTHTLLYGDTALFFGWQLLHDQKGTCIPDLRILTGESFPTGKYDKLNPKKMGSDVSGTGSYQTLFIVVCRKIFYVFPRHPFDLNLNLYYIVSSNAHVQGFNLYGGGKGTRGSVHPGDQYIGNLAFEYSLNRNWALGIDIRYEHRAKSTFHGKPGTLENGTTPIVGLPSSERFSLAPCLEYSFSETFSITAGSWFTVAGRNASAFFSGGATLFYEF